MSEQADRWIKWTTTGCVGLLALIAGTVSYLHMHLLIARYGQPGWVAALTPLSVDGMIVAASTTLLADSRSGQRGGVLPWALLVVSSLASLAANVAVAEPTLVGRVIAAWPSFALTASYELPTREVRHGAAEKDVQRKRLPKPQPPRPAQVAARTSAQGLRAMAHSAAERGGQRAGGELRRQAWHWALAHRDQDGILPSGEAIACAHGRHERWGRLVKNAGLAGTFGTYNAQVADLVATEGSGGPLAQHHYLSTEDAWTAAKNVDPIPDIQDVNLMGMADYLSRLVEALRSPNLAAGEKAREASAEATVGQCFAQAGLWWVIVSCFALVVLIVGVIMSGGGLAAVAAQILGILIGAGIWATLGGIIALVICLGGSVGVQFN